MKSSRTCHIAAFQILRQCHRRSANNVQICSVIVQIPKRCRATSAFVPIPNAVRESVKSKILDEATREDSRLWQSSKHHFNPEQSNSSIDTNVKATSYDVNESTLDGFDNLDDLNIQGVTRYWPNLPDGVDFSIDPFELAKVDLERLSASIREDLIGTDHTVLNMAASYFFESSVDGGKKVRPMMVLLLSRALAETLIEKTSKNNLLENRSLSSKVSPNVSLTLLTEPAHWQRPDLPVAQRRLAEISEMIHTASLFHDDVIDGSEMRRGKPSAHRQFGNKMAILAGDYLLARASIFLARLRNVHVVETMSTIIEHLVRGEVMQLRHSRSTDSSTNDRMGYYLRKNFYKTGSLMANSCKSAALLGNYNEKYVETSYRYGKHVGMAFQLVDDVLDFEGSSSELGKPALSDLKAGLATAPLLFATEQFPELNNMIDRKFKNDGDVELAVELVFKSNGIERTKQLARIHAEYAMDAILQLDSSQHRDSLVRLAYAVVARTK